MKKGNGKREKKMALFKMCVMNFLGSWEIITPWVIIFMVTSSKKGKKTSKIVWAFFSDVFKHSKIC